MATTAATVEPMLPAASASRMRKRPQKLGDGGTPLSSAHATRRGQIRPASAGRSRIGASVRWVSTMISAPVTAGETRAPPTAATQSAMSAMKIASVSRARGSPHRPEATPDGAPEARPRGGRVRRRARHHRARPRGSVRRGAARPERGAPATARRRAGRRATEDPRGPPTERVDGEQRGHAGDEQPRHDDGPRAGREPR